MGLLPATQRLRYQPSPNSDGRAFGQETLTHSGTPQPQNSSSGHASPPFATRVARFVPVLDSSDALWVFRRMFGLAPFSPLGGGTFHANYNHLEVMSSLYSCYYRSGLANRNVCPHDWSGSSWMKAIWNIRQRRSAERPGG